MEGALSRTVSLEERLGASRQWLTLANAPERLATSIDLIVTGDTWSCAENDSSAFSQEGGKNWPQKRQASHAAAECGAGSRPYPRYPSRGVANQYHIYSQHSACICK